MAVSRRTVPYSSRRYLAAGLALAGALAGCGGHPSAAPSGPAALVGAAAARTSAAGSASVTLSAVVSAQGLPGGALQFAVGGRGPVSFARDQAQLSFSGPGTVLAGVPLVVRYLAGVVEVDGPAVGRPAGRFVRLDASTTLPAATGSVFAIQPQQLTTLSPLALLAPLTTLTGVRRLGAATLAGVATTEFSGRLAASAAPALSGLVPGLGGAGGVPLPEVEVWLDQAGRVRQIRADVDVSSLLALAGGGAAVHGSALFTLALSDFGVAVRLAAN